MTMRHYAIAPPPIYSLPITGSDKRFPVRRIFCVGRNYAEHIREMGGDPDRSTPFFFTKSRDALVQSGTTIPMPPQTDNLHYEVELVVAMKSATEIFGYAAGLDMTRRDLQASAKKGGKPWDMAKNFDQSAPCGPIMRHEEYCPLGHTSILLMKNDIIKQTSMLDHMIWTVEEIIEHLSSSVTIGAGDLIFTGTPEGVGPVKAGETLRGEIDGLDYIEVTYA